MNVLRLPIRRMDDPGAAKAKAGGSSWWVDDDDWDEAAIPLRSWLVPGYLMRGCVSVLAGPPGAGKSALTVAWCLAISRGQPFHRFHPKEAGRVMLLNVEDDAMEQRRRMSAAMRHANATPAQVKGRIIRVGPEHIGTLIMRDPKTGFIKFTAAMIELEAMLAERQVDMLVLDPLVELHNADENDNTALRAVVAEFRSVAVRHNIAILLLHHTRKGSGASAGDPESLRGAGSIGGAVRVTLTLMPMTGAEAQQFGLDPAEAVRRLFRVDGAKANYAARGGPEWFEHVEYTLDNGEGTAAALPWKPPAEIASPEVMDKLLADIAKGSPQGPWAPTLTKYPRSVRGLLTRHGITGLLAEARTMHDLTTKHGVQTVTFRGLDRKPGKGLRTAEGLPNVEWEG